MPAYGGMSYYPRRYGGGTPASKLLTDSLGQARGTGLDTSRESNVYPEVHADARAIAALYSAARRLRNQFDPLRVSDFLRRWEKILRAPPLPGDTTAQRRARIAAKLRGLPGASPSVVSAMCAELLGSMFVGVEYTSLDDAVMHWPGTSEPDEWYSTVAHIVVRVQKLARQRESDFYQSMQRLTEALDDALPAWVTFDWARFGDNGLSGFYLDEENNLDNQAFD